MMQLEIEVCQFFIPLSMFSTVYYLLQSIFFSHIDLSLCHILSKILWLKQDACGKELPPPFLFSAYIFIFNNIS